MAQEKKIRRAPGDASLRLRRRLFRKRCRELDKQRVPYNKPLSMAWVRGYLLNPAHPGSVSVRAPRANEWPKLFARCPSLRTQEAFYEGYCEGMW